MQVRILGEVDIAVEGGGPVVIGSRSQRIVLAVLASRLGSIVEQGTLVDALWGDEPPPSAAPSLRTYVSRLRRHLGEALEITPAGYRLDLDPDDLDAARAERLAASSPAERPTATRERLDEALALWRGPSLAGLGDVAVLRGTAVRLDDLRSSIRDARINALVAEGSLRDAVGAAEELLAEEPLRERTWVLLVEALTADGRAPDAVRAARRATEALADAGLVPSDALRRAEQGALEGGAPPSTVAPEPSHPPTPRPAGELVGRDEDLAALSDRLRSSRLVTLVGPGGVGKTRLALELAQRLGGEHRWGARLVRLSSVSDDDAVLAAVADALGLSPDSGGDDATLAHAAGLDLLVVLDNCEHVVDEAARAATILTTAGGSATVLATSRSPLEVDGEQVWPIDPLDPTGSARELFEQRARAARPDVELEPDLVERVVRRVDALPLAIEMAAAQVRHVPMPELVRRLDDEIDALRSTRRDADARHRTLDAVVEWSERLLDDDEHRLFREMSVFERPATADDVAAVTGRSDPFDLLCRLADRSLLVTDLRGRSARFGMLRTIRRRAADRLAARPEDLTSLSASHAAWVVDALEEADGWLRSPDELRAHERFHSLVDDARRALAWCRLHDPDSASRLCAATYVWAQTRLRDEVLGWSSDLVDSGDVELDPSTRPTDALVLCAASFRAASRGDIEVSGRLAARAATSADPVARAFAAEVESDADLYRGDLASAADAARRGLADARTGADPLAWTAAVVGLALAASYAGDDDGAAAALEERWDGPPLPPTARAWLAYTEGEIVLDRDPERAFDRLHAAIDLAESVDDHYVAGVARVSTSSLHARTGDPDAARAAFVDSIRHWRRRGDQTHQLTTLRNLVALWERVGRPDHAAELLGTVAGADITPSFGAEADRLGRATEWARGELGTEESASLVARGRGRTIDEAATLALEWLEREEDAPRAPYSGT